MYKTFIRIIAVISIVSLTFFSTSPAYAKTDSKSIKSYTNSASSKKNSAAATSSKSSSSSKSKTTNSSAKSTSSKSSSADRDSEELKAEWNEFWEKNGWAFRCYATTMGTAFLEAAGIDEDDIEFPDEAWKQDKYSISRWDDKDNYLVTVNAKILDERWTMLIVFQLEPGKDKEYLTDDDNHAVHYLLFTETYGTHEFVLCNDGYCDELLNKINDLVEGN